tara:strand:+ start:55 stop:201 length:147 start_codon:yes stop_codon:yes gene_type:complete
MGKKRPNGDYFAHNRPWIIGAIIFSSPGLWLVLDGCLGVDAFVCLIGW